MARGEKRDQAAIAQRRERVATLYLQGWSMWQIAQHEDIVRQTVASDIEAVRKLWLDSAMMAWGARKEQELAKIDHLEQVAWTEWERSLKPCVTRAREKKPSIEVEGSALIVTKRTVRREERLGDPRYLDQVQWCITQRCKILGVDIAKPPPNLTGPEDDAAIVASATAEEAAKIREAREILARLGAKK